MASTEPLSPAAPAVWRTAREVSFRAYLWPWAMLLALATVAVPVNRTAAQCPDWIPTFGAMSGTDFDVNALAVFDDGRGPALYAGGRFGSAGGVEATMIARWDGTAWSPLESGLYGRPGAVHALAVFDDGTGPALYAGGQFTGAGSVLVSNIAKWDGNAWSSVGSGFGGEIRALAVFDNGTGPALYAGGTPDPAGGVPATSIARWNGAAWSPVANGPDGVVSTLTVFDDGTGAALYAGGSFTHVGPTSANRIARWNGATWSPLASGLDGAVTTLTVFDHGSGPALYAGGSFLAAGGDPATYVAKWDGTGWSSLGSGPGDVATGGGVFALTVFDDGTGPSLYIGGRFQPAGGGWSFIARWNGVAWSPLGGDVGHDVLTLTVFDDGAGPALYAGGRFTTAGGRSANRVAKWDGASWSHLGGNGLDGTVNCLTVFESGTGPALYAGGYFNFAGGREVSRVAKWDGGEWSSLGSGLGGRVSDLAVFDDGAGPALYACGDFDITRWDGTQWSPFGGVFNDSVHALAVFDDGAGATLYAGGEFTSAGGTFASHITKWNGAHWAPLGSGVDAIVVAMKVFNDGAGPALYAGGFFRSAGGAPASKIAKWDGFTWAPLGSGLENGVVRALQVFDDGTGPALYAGGNFSSAGGAPANCIARWDGIAWSPLGSGLSGNLGVATSVDALTVFDYGAGTALYAGGAFAIAGDNPADYIAKWSGTSWSALGSGTRPYVYALHVFDDGTGRTLCVGGSFGASPAGDSHLARYGCVNEPTCLAELTGESPVDVFDLLAYLNLWFATSPDAERTGDTPAAIDVFDLLTYLDAWFPESAAGCS